MKRFLAPLALALIAGTTAHAQTQPYNTNAGWSGSAGTSVVGTIAGQSVNGGFPNYASTANNAQVPTYGYVYAPSYNYNSYSNYNSYNYPNYGGYGGYAGYAGYPGTYVIPSQTTYIGRSQFGWDTPPSITSLPQVVTNGVAVPVLPYGYGSYGYPVSGTYSSTGVLPNGVISYNSVTVDAGGPRNRPIQRNAFGRPIPPLRTR